MRISLRGYAVVFWMVIQCTGYAQWSNGTDYFGYWEYANQGLPTTDSLRHWGVRHIRVVKDDGDSIALDYDRKYRLKRVYVHAKNSEREDRPKYTRKNRIRSIRRKANWDGTPTLYRVNYTYEKMSNGWTRAIQTVLEDGDFHSRDTTDILEQEGQVLGMKSRYYGEFLYRLEYRGDTTDLHIQTPQWNYLAQGMDTARYTIRTVYNSLQQPVFREYIYHHYYTDCGVGMMFSTRWSYDTLGRLVDYREFRGGYDVCYTIAYRPDGSRVVNTSCMLSNTPKEEERFVVGPGDYLWPERIMEYSARNRYYFE